MIFKETKKEKQENYILRLLRYGHYKESFSIEDAIRDLGLNESELVNFHNDCHIEPSTPLFKAIYPNNFEENGKRVFKITSRGVSQYIEYIELKEARKAAFISQIFAIIAIGISIVTLIISIYFQAHYVSKVEVVNPAIQICQNTTTILGTNWFCLP